MSTRQRIDSLLRGQEFSSGTPDESAVYRYAEAMAAVENCVVVVSDLSRSTSRIFRGTFARRIGLPEGYNDENSIWEKEILTLMTPEECDEKYLAELRFFTFLRHIPRRQRENYYLATALRFTTAEGESVDVLHRMYYRYEADTEAVRYGICVYGPLTLPLPGRSIAVDSLSGKIELLTSEADQAILSSREKQVLTLIERGYTSQRIADELCISRNTVSRHRQSILARLQARNSTEACLRAKQLRIL